MSRATKRKHVMKEVLDNMPEPGPGQLIVRVVRSCGRDLHEAVWPDGHQAIVSMPAKYRNVVWIKRGDHVIVDPIEEGDKVVAEITSILYADQIKNLKKAGLWPSAFDSNIPAETEVDDMLPPAMDEGSESEDDMDQLGPNPNRMAAPSGEAEDDSQDDNDDDD